jgi:hypothetical protein
MSSLTGVLMEADMSDWIPRSGDLCQAFMAYDGPLLLLL